MPHIRRSQNTEGRLHLTYLLLLVLRLSHVIGIPASNVIHYMLYLIQPYYRNDIGHIIHTVITSLMHNGFLVTVFKKYRRNIVQTVDVCDFYVRIW